MYNSKIPPEKSSLKTGTAAPAFTWCWGHDKGQGVQFKSVGIKDMYKHVTPDPISKFPMLVINNRTQDLLKTKQSESNTPSNYFSFISK